MLSVIDGSKLIGNPGERADGAAKGSIQPVEEIDAVRFRVYPSRVQQQVLKRWIGAQRYIYNQKV